MDAASILAIASSALQLVNKLVDRSPSYSEKEKKKFAEAVRDFKTEVAKPKEDRDHVLIFKMWNELQKSAEEAVRKI